MNIKFKPALDLLELIRRDAVIYPDRTDAVDLSDRLESIEVKANKLEKLLRQLMEELK